jgi:hypothetical protein
VLTKQWEEKRLDLIAERDAKIKQLLEKADGAQTKTEKQLLMQQAKHFGQRMDTQIERAWEDQKSQRDERWAIHNQAKQESRQRFKDESLSVQQQAEGLVSATDRFQDMARARLGGPEDAWARNVEKASAITSLFVKGQNLSECLKALGLDSTMVPRRGSQYGGISDVAEVVEKFLSSRSCSRSEACSVLQEQSLQQLRQCVERFIQNEGTQQKKSILTSSDEVEKAPEYSQAVIMKSLLQARQHRVVADTIRRQFNDFLVVLRLACLGVVHLLPENVAKNYQFHVAKLDLPAAPEELLNDM